MKSENRNTQMSKHLKEKVKDWKKPAIQTLLIQSGTLQDGPFPPPEGS